MKILFVVEHFYPYVGGAEELFLNLTTSLAQEGHHVHVVTTQFDKSIPKIEEYKGVRISRISCHNRFLFTFFSLPEILRSGKTADLIHTTSYNSAIPSFLAGLLLKKKVIITFHEVWGKLWFRLPYTPRWKLTLFYLYEKFILKLPFHKYIAVSEYTKQSLLSHGIKESKIEQIYNGVDYTVLAKYKHQPPENFTFCYFGRLGISKGINLLLEAAPLFFAKHPEAKLKLIIPTYPAALYRKIINSTNTLSRKNNILLKHNLSRDELLKEVSSSSCVIIPSYSEGFCFVAVESAGMGVPVISSGQGSLPEVVNGKYIPLTTLSPEAIHSALETAYKKIWNQKDLHNFTLEKSMKGYINLYANLNRK